MSFLKSKFGLIAMLVVVLVVVLTLVFVNRGNSNSDASGSTVIGSPAVPTPTAPSNDVVSDEENQGGLKDNWPEDWPAKPSNPVPIPVEDDGHNHDPAAEEGAALGEGLAPEVIPSDYVDDLGHEHNEEGEGTVVPSFPSYKPIMTKFAKAYLDTSKTNSAWLKGVSPYISDRLKDSYKGFDPSALGEQSGEVRLADESDNTTGKVKFSIYSGDTKVAIILAQYQMDWTVLEIDAP